MSISSTIESIACPGSLTVARFSRFGAEIRNRLAAALASRRDRRAAARLGRTRLDARTLRDIGVTPLGLREAALAAGNEARLPAGGRS